MIVDKTCEKVLKLKVEHVFNNKSESSNFFFSFLNEKSYNKTVIVFNLSRHKDLSTLKSDIHFFG